MPHVRQGPIMKLLLICLLSLSAARVYGQSLLDKKLVARAKKIYGSSASNTVTYGDSNDPAPTFDHKETSGTQRTEASFGDTASGVILLESGDTLYLDTRPCTSHVIPFNKPYKKIKIGSITCNGKQVDRYQVEAKRR